MKFLSILCYFLATGSIAQPLENKENFKLIQLSESDPPQWISEQQFFKMIEDGTHFFDRTDVQIDQSSMKESLNEDIQSSFQVPTDIKYRSQTEKAHSFINIDRAKNFITKLSSYHTRYYNTTTGVQAAEFIRDHLKSITSSYNDKMTVEEFQHSWAQRSVIVKMTGSEFPDEIVVIGAHLDSINRKDPQNGRSPGADDDGSGVALLLETLQSFIQSGFKPKRTIEFQFFSAEEVGLKGSQDIAQTYKKQGKNVVAMIQEDMVGYRAPNVNSIGVFSDYTDPSLNNLIRLLIQTYTNCEVEEKTCGYACSDHASYHEQGYRATRTREPILGPGYHTENDVIGDMDFEYFKEFCKLAIGFATEIAEPSSFY